MDKLKNFLGNINTKIKAIIIMAILIIILLAITLPIALNKDDNQEIYYTPGLDFVLINEDNLYSVSKGEVPANTQTIIIPAFYQGLPVVSIGNKAFENMTGLETIHIPETISHIEPNAFNGCSNLKNFVMPSGNENFTLVNGVLFSADLLKLVRYPQAKAGVTYSIPDNTTIIGDYAFYGCTLLTQINLPNSLITLGYNCFSYTSITEILIPENVLYIGQTSFMYCDLLININVEDQDYKTIIQDEITYQKKYYSVDGIIYCLIKLAGELPVLQLSVYPTGRYDSEFYVPEGVEALSMGAFAGTRVLYVYFPDGFKSFSMHNFLLSSAKGITVPSTVENMSSFTLTGIEYINIFAETPPSTGMALFNSNTLIYVPADYVDAYKTEWSEFSNRIFAMPVVSFQEGEGQPVNPMIVGYNNRLGAIEGGYFADNYAVEWYTDALLEELFDLDIKITGDTTLYAKYTKLYSAGLAYFDYSNGDYNGYSVAIGDCEDSDIIIPEYHPLYPNIPVLAVESEGFKNVSGINSVTLPSTMRVILESAFEECSLTYISLPDGLIEIEAYGFYGAALTELYIPSSVEFIGAYAFSWNLALVSVVFGDHSILETLESTFESCEVLTTVDFGLYNSIKYFTYTVFYDCVNLSTILNLNNLIEIGEAVFENCISLTEFVMPSTLEYFGSRAFMNCTSLTEISFEGCIMLEEIGQEAFKGCSNLERVLFGDDSNISRIQSQAFEDCINLREVNFGAESKIVRFDPFAFFNCQALEIIELPEMLQEISSYAFKGCDLSVITLPAGMEYIAEEAFADNQNLTVVISLAETPPSVYICFLNNTHIDLKIYVYPDSLALYQSVWDSFTDIIYPLPTVSFNTYGGSEISNQILFPGEKVVQPQDPIKQNHIFQGWYTDVGYATEFNYDTLITEDTVIHALWQEV